MATGTLAGGASISHDTSAVDLAALVVTQLAGDVLVGTGERERGSGVMVELARRPVRRVMAGCAIHRLLAPLELPRMDVFMATYAALRRGLERDLPNF